MMDKSIITGKDKYKVIKIGNHTINGRMTNCIKELSINKSVNSFIFLVLFYAELRQSRSHDRRE